MLYLILLLLLLLAGGFLLVKGLRGRQLDEHPVCARCGFDLVGKPHDSQVCSECGTDVTTPHAIRVGNRARRPRLIYFGASMLLVGLSWMGLLISGVSSTTFVRYEPTWWLVHEMHSSDRSVRSQAITELSRRITTGKLSKAQLTDIADDVLQLQADLSRTWDPAWGDLFRDADSSGAVSAEQWKQFGLHAPKLSFKVRSKVTSGDPVVYSIQQTAARVGNRQAIVLRISHFILNLDGHQARNDSSSRGLLSATGSSSMTLSMSTGSFASKLKPGKHTLRVAFDADLCHSMNENAKPFAHKHIEMAADFQLLPTSQPSVSINHNPSLRAAVEKALKVTITRNPSLCVNVRVNHVPVGIGYEVIIHGATHESKAGEFACPAGTHNHQWGLNPNVHDMDDNVVDVEFKPSVETAQRTLNTFEVWDHPILIKGVKVRHR